MYHKPKKITLMKYILLLILIINMHLYATSQIVLGTYSSQNSANKVKLQLDAFIQNDNKFKKFLLKSHIRSMVKQNNGYFIVVLKPINDIITQHAIINRVKKYNFKDAYPLNLTPPTKFNEDALLKKEPKIDNIPIENITIDTSNNHIKKELQSFNLLERYFNELIAILAILIVSIIYLSIKKRQHTKNQFTNYNSKKRASNKEETKEDLSIPIESYGSLQQFEEPQKEEIYQLKNEGAISFDLLDDTHEESSSPRSSISKREITSHQNTTKADFRDFDGTRIMIAEDNIINQKVIQGLLSESGIETVMVNNGQEVLDFLQKDSNFCIILMDAHMPKMDGYEATQIIRANPRYDHITIIALSGDTAVDDIKKMEKVGMQEHLEKPLKMAPLYDLLNAYAYKKSNASPVQELDEKRGLDICGGDKDFYKEILEDFLKKYGDSNRFIQELLDSQHYGAVQNLLLDIGSLSTNIGAKKVGSLANELRVSLNEPKKEQYLPLLETYAKYFEALKTEVKKYLNP